MKKYWIHFVSFSSSGGMDAVIRKWGEVQCSDRKHGVRTSMHAGLLAFRFSVCCFSLCVFMI